jgi:group I intron endonuclease
MFYIYEIKHRKTGLRYIGYSKNVKGRWKEHKRDLTLGKHHSQYLQRAWNKYGENLFEFNIIETCIKLEEVKLREKELISLNTEGYNVASGGTGGNTRAGMTKRQAVTYSKKLSEAQKKRYQNPAERLKCNGFANLTEEQRKERLKKWSEAKKGPNNNNFRYPKPVQQIDKHTGETVKVWENAWTAAQAGFTLEYVLKCCQGKPKYHSHKGFIWKWVS